MIKESNVRIKSQNVNDESQVNLLIHFKNLRSSQYDTAQYSEDKF